MDNIEKWDLLIKIQSLKTGVPLSAVEREPQEPVRDEKKKMHRT